MKINKWVVMFLSCLILIDIGSRFVPSVGAQSIGVSPSTATTLAGCPPPAASFMNFCQVTNDPGNPSGAYVTANGAAYFLLQKAGGGGGVSSVFGRTGAVVAQAGDYSYGQISSPPPMVNTFAGRSGAVVPSANDYGYSMLSGTAPMRPSFTCATFSFINSANPPLAVGGCQ